MCFFAFAFFFFAVLVLVFLVFGLFSRALEDFCDAWSLSSIQSLRFNALKPGSAIISSALIEL
jgi:hypothetical protein